MDPAVQRLWNEWCDRRIAAALEAERERFEERLRALEIKVLDLVAEAFTTNADATATFVERAIRENAKTAERAITENAKNAERLLIKFNNQVQGALERREQEFGARERETVN
jgi:hypothetical protein